MKRPIIFGAGACALAVAVSSCSSEGIYGIPLPGGPEIGSNPMHLTIQFEDVLDLVPQSAVKVDGVPVGRVESIKVAPDGWTADVEVVIDSSVDLAANTIAAIDQTSLLGEKFVQLSEPPGDKDPERLEDGDRIDLDRTRQATEIEQVFGALSLLLNGGGVGQLQPIVHELSAALDGREDRVRGLLEQANTLIDGLNQQRDDITRALDGLGTLTTRVDEQNEKIGLILDELPIAADVLNEQRPQLTQLLVQLDQLGAVGTDVINRSKDDLIADLLALRPTLRALAESGDDLPNSLAFIPTLPFPDGIEKLALGGSVNLFLSIDLQIGNALSALGVGQGDPVYVPPKFGEPKPIVDPSNPYYNGNGPKPGWPTVSLLPILPTIPAPTPVSDPNLPEAAPADGEDDIPAGESESPQNPLTGLLEQFGIGGGQ
ncbi:MCE family protein [Rhodococcus sp. NPDC049939]|uniref:MCE family protein n=1 Tax=Rhodococcus sp. NPDC049939 TaxID=3155511 RepID=UPI0033CC24FC